MEFHTALIEMSRGWMLHLGPTTHQALCEKLLLALETTGLILRGNFRSLAKDNVEWCERRLLAKLRRGLPRGFYFLNPMAFLINL